MADRLALLGGEPLRPSGPPEWPPRRPAIRAVLEEAYARGAWGLYEGPCLEELRRDIAALHGTPFVELCASGTVAVELALRGIGIQPGDEVILAAYDFKGNFSNVHVLGATPVLVDLDPLSWNMEPRQLQSAITERTKAIIVSHLHGGVVPMGQVMALARAAGLKVIEDACQMPGGEIEGQRAGSTGDVGIWSFGGSKLLAAGRGGALFTRDEAIAQRVKLYCQRGNHAYPLSELQAAVLLPQLQTLDADNRQRASNAKWLTDKLMQKVGLTPFQSSEVEAEPGYYKLGLQYDPSGFSDLSREVFLAAIRAEGIALNEGFRALHASHARRRYRACGDLIEASRADQHAIVLHHPVLLEETMAMEEIVAAIEKVRQHASTLHDRVDPSA